jgi:hypothetical protein
MDRFTVELTGRDLERYIEERSGIKHVQGSFSRVKPPKVKRPKPYPVLDNTLECVAVKRENNSGMGNPKFRFIMSNGVEIYTPANVGWAYTICPNHLSGKLLRVVYQMNRYEKFIMKSYEEGMID